MSHQGGKILLGIDDDGSIVGIQRADLKQWVMNTVFARYVHPWILPSDEGWISAKAGASR